MTKLKEIAAGVTDTHEPLTGMESIPVADRGPAVIETIWDRLA